MSARRPLDTDTREGRALTALLHALGETGRKIMREHLLARAEKPICRETLEAINDFEHGLKLLEKARAEGRI